MLVGVPAGSTLGCHVAAPPAVAPAARVPGAAQPAGPITAQVHEIEAVLGHQRDAWNRGDLVAFMDAYVHDDTLIFTSAGKVRRGWAQTLERYRARYGDAGAMGKLTFWDLETTVLADGVALVLGRWRLHDTPEAGEGVFSLVFVRVDHDWQILHDHTSVLVADDPPVPPQ